MEAERKEGGEERRKNIVYKRSKLGNLSLISDCITDPWLLIWTKNCNRYQGTMSSRIRILHLWLNIFDTRTYILFIVFIPRL